MISEHRSRVNQKRCNARARWIKQGLKRRLRGMGHTVDRDLDRIDDITIGVRIEPEHDGDGRTKNRLRIKIGSAFEVLHQFPEPKAGFDLRRIAEFLSARVAARKAEIAKRSAEREAEWHSGKLVREVAAALGLEVPERETWAFGDGWSLDAAPHASRVKVEIALVLEPEAAERLCRLAGHLYAESEEE